METKEVEMEMEMEQRKEAEKRVRSLKMTKSRNKSVFTRVKNQLINAMSEDVDKSEINSMSDKLGSALERTMEGMDMLVEAYIQIDDSESADIVTMEMEKIEVEYASSK